MCSHSHKAEAQTGSAGVRLPGGLPWEFGSGKVSLATKCMTVVFPKGSLRAEGQTDRWTESAFWSQLHRRKQEAHRMPSRRATATQRWSDFHSHVLLRRVVVPPAAAANSLPLPPPLSSSVKAGLSGALSRLCPAAQERDGVREVLSHLLALRCRAESGPGRSA